MGNIPAVVTGDQWHWWLRSLLSRKELTYPLHINAKTTQATYLARAFCLLSPLLINHSASTQGSGLCSEQLGQIVGMPVRHLPWLLCVPVWFCVQHNALVEPVFSYVCNRRCSFLPGLLAEVYVIHKNSASFVLWPRYLGHRYCHSQQICQEYSVLWMCRFCAQYRCQLCGWLHGIILKDLQNE